MFGEVNFEFEDGLCLIFDASHCKIIEKDDSYIVETLGTSNNGVTYEKKTMIDKAYIQSVSYS